MTVGVFAPREIYQITTGWNPPAVDSRTVVNGVGSGDVLNRGGVAGADAHHLPLATYHAARGSSPPATSFEYNDWYFRIHVVPSSLALGNVVSNEQFTIGVWNAWVATPQTLNSFTDTTADGITLAGPPSPPLVYAPNQQVNYTLSVSTVGPPAIAVSVVFTFADAEIPALAITGSRITAWALTPDWQTAVRERVGFLTDILRAWSGREQRRALRIAPRRVFNFSTLAIGKEKRFIENSLFAWAAMTWALPIFPDGQRSPAPITAGMTSVACDTVNRDFVDGGLAIVIQDAATYEVLQIATVTPTALKLTRVVVGNWPAGIRLYPVRAARMLTYPRVTRESQSIMSISPEFTVTDACDWPPAAALPVYRTCPVLEDSPDVSTAQGASYERDANITDAATGAIDVDDTAGMGFPSTTHQWYLNGRTARANFRSLLYTLKGRWSLIWVPSYDEDILLVENVAANNVAITVEEGGFTQFAIVQNRRDIRIELYGGTVLYRRLVGSGSTAVPGAEVLEMDSALGIAITPAQVRRISFMTLSRLDADEIEIQHLSMADGLATAQTPFKSVNYEPAVTS